MKTISTPSGGQKPDNYYLWLASVEGGKRVWDIIKKKAILDPFTKTYTVRFTPEEMELVISMSNHPALNAK